MLAIICSIYVYVLFKTYRTRYTFGSGWDTVESKLSFKVEEI
mgnify:CR=1 FL=1